MPRPIPILAAALAALPAAAQEGAVLDGAQLDALLRGHTAYIAVPPGPAGGTEGGVAPFHYGADGAAAARLPAGTTLVGTWSVRDGRYCVDWDNGPKNSCTAIRKVPGAIELIDRASGDARGTVERIVPGNPEDL